jgi:hypothetical protein
MDTMPVGGDEQREEMRRMHIHDELQADLKALRDSVVSSIDTMNSSSVLPELKSIAKDLDPVLKQFSGTEADTALYRKGLELLTRSRAHYRKVLLSTDRQ